MISRLISFLRVFIVSVVLLAVLTLMHVLSFYSHSATKPADCIVVFGAAVWPGYYGPVASHALADRTVSAVSLYKQGLARCVVLSGADSIYGAHEVDIMTDIMLKEGVPEGAIELDREGVNTLATISNLDKSRSYILVSNDFHLARIGLLAQREGLGREGFTLHKAQYGAGSGLDGSAARYSREPFFIFREMGALWYYFFSTLF